MNIEYVIVTDYKLYQKWYEDTDTSLTPEYRDLWTKYLMMEFYHHVVNGIDLIFTSTQPYGMDFHVVLSGLVVANASGLTPWTENNLACPGCNTVDDQKVLLEFANWRRKNLLPRLNHDHATLFTGYDLYYEALDSRKTVGLSYLSMMCSNWSVAVVEDHRNALTSHVAAHELGHSLGAGHDGRDGIVCSEEDMYLMAPQMAQVSNRGKARNPWTFSHCSIDDISGFIGRLIRDNNNCLINDPLEQPLPFNKMAGQTYSGDDQCKFTFGEKSSVCREKHYFDWWSICYGLACRNPETNRCQMILPHDGTSCGDKMWCRQGQCLHNAKAPAVNGVCVMGDDPHRNCSISDCDVYQTKFGSCCQSCLNSDNRESSTATDSFLVVQTLKDSDLTTTTTTELTHERFQPETTPDLQIGGGLVKDIRSSPEQKVETTPEGLLIFTLESKSSSRRTTTVEEKSPLETLPSTTTGPNVLTFRNTASTLIYRTSPNTLSTKIPWLTLPGNENHTTYVVSNKYHTSTRSNTPLENITGVNSIDLDQRSQTQITKNTILTTFPGVSLKESKTTSFIEKTDITTKEHQTHITTDANKLPSTKLDTSTENYNVSQLPLTTFTDGDIDHQSIKNDLDKTILTSTTTQSSSIIQDILSTGDRNESTTTSKYNYDSVAPHVKSTVRRRFFDCELENLITVFVSLTMFI